MEYHLFIIWEKAQWKKNDILEDIRKELCIIKIIDITWDPSRFSDNLSRFYGQNLPHGSKKEEECGNGTFTLIVVRDDSPCYEPRTTSHGRELVNRNIFDKKEKFRSWTNDKTTPPHYHGSRVHGTNNEKEARHDLAALLGISPEDLANQAEAFPNQWSENVTGLDGWENLTQLFYIMNQSVNYLVLRNSEYLPQTYQSEQHGDIDLLTDDLKRMKWILGGVPVFKATFRVHYRVKIGQEDVYFDLRYVGDDYYCKAWEEEMLLKQVDSGKGFPVLSLQDYQYSLLYHALIQKPRLSSDYKQKLRDLFDCREEDYLEELQKFMSAKNYDITLPRDLSVYINEMNSGKRFGLIRKIYYLIQKLDKHIFFGKIKF
ncbi:MAG: hypothetical protein ACI4HI_16655 [Lachnospiraceae bacterium]